VAIGQPAPGRPDDLAACVVAAQRGDAAAFDTLYVTVQPGLLRYLRGLVGADADDVATEAWLQIVRDLVQCQILREGSELLVRDFRLGRWAVLVDHATEDPLSPDRRVECEDDGRIVVGRVLIQTLMWTVSVEVMLVFTKHCAGVLLVVDQHPIGALPPWR